MDQAVAIGGQGGVRTQEWHRRRPFPGDQREPGLADDRQ